LETNQLVAFHSEGKNTSRRKHKIFFFFLDLNIFYVYNKDMMFERLYRYEWGEVKNAENIEKHEGLTLPDGIGVFADKKRIIRPDLRKDYGEKRYNIVGATKGMLLCVCFTPRGFLKRRIISVRCASKKERKAYYV
jgi:uncharacterized DUF497 family protein